MPEDQEVPAETTKPAKTGSYTVIGDWVTEVEGGFARIGIGTVVTLSAEEAAPLLADGVIE
jgi:hypothetical protein